MHNMQAVHICFADTRAENIVADIYVLCEKFCGDVLLNVLFEKKKTDKLHNIF